MKASYKGGATARLVARHSKFGLWLVAVSLCLFTALPAFAQSGRVLIDDPDGLFRDRAAVQAAADRLAGEGVDVVVVGVRNAGPNAQNYIDNRLQELPVAQNTRALQGNQIVFYVAPQPGFDGLYFVSRYKDKLQPAYQQITRQQMRPRFTQEDYSGGMVAGIDAVRTTLNPPTSPVVWIGAGAVALFVIASVARPVLRQRKAAADALTSARSRMDEARRAAGVALADLGRHVTAAQEKAPYDKLSYSAADAARIGDLQTRGESLFTEAQSAFDSAEQVRSEASRPSAADYEALAQKYLDIQRLAGEAIRPIEEAEQMRATLDAAGAPSTGQTQRL